MLRFTKSDYFVRLSDLVTAEPHTQPHRIVHSLCELNFDTSLQQADRPILIALDIDRTLIFNDPERLTESGIPSFVHRLNENPLIHTMGFTARQSAHAYLTNQMLSNLGIQFKCELPIEFNPSACRLQYSWENKQTYFNPIFDKSSGILFTDYNVNKGLFLEGFLPGLKEYIHGFHVIDDNEASLESIAEVATDNHNLPPVLTYHYLGPNLTHSPTIKNLYQLGRF